MNESSWLDINLTRLEQNLLAFRAMVATDNAGDPDTQSQSKPPLICGVVKADAYGLGASTIAQRLVAKGVDMLAVYSTNQAADLLRVSMNCPILLLAPMRELTRTHALYRAAVTGRLHLTIHDLPQIEQILKMGTTFGCTFPVHLHVDSGMSRSGLSHDEFAQALQRISTLRHLRVTGVYTHLASAQAASDSAQQQLDQFEKLLSQNAGLIPENTITHIANTFATCRHRQFHRQMVRIGLGLYGYGPELLETDDLLDNVVELKPIARWRSVISHVQRYPKGATVGYDSTFTCQRDSVLGVIPVGYADGYPLALSDKSVVVLPDMLIAGRAAAAPVRGKINMDQIVIDLTDIPGVVVGTQVDLISDDPTSPCALPKLAKQANSHCYELLTRLSSRIPRNTIYNQDKNLK